jgi:hypothetical protein
VEGKLLFNLSKEVKAAMAVEAVSSPDLFNAGLKDGETITGITGETV